MCSPGCWASCAAAASTCCLGPWGLRHTACIAGCQPLTAAAPNVVSDSGFGEHTSQEGIQCVIGFAKAGLLENRQSYALDPLWSSFKVGAV